MLTPGALERTEAAREVEGTVARHARTLAGHLLSAAWLVLNTTRLVSPGPILLHSLRSQCEGWGVSHLTHGHVVPAEGAHHQAGVSWVGLGAITSKPRAGHQSPSSSPSSVFLGGPVDFLTPPSSSVPLPILLASPSRY